MPCGFVFSRGFLLRLTTKIPSVAALSKTDAMVLPTGVVGGLRQRPRSALPMRCGVFGWSPLTFASDKHLLMFYVCEYAEDRPLQFLAGPYDSEAEAVAASGAYEVEYP